MKNSQFSTEQIITILDQAARAVGEQEARPSAVEVATRYQKLALNEL
jgi:hypothetical protein